MLEDKWGIDSTWYGDQSSKISLKGTVKKAIVSFTLAEKFPYTDKV